ncbi:MAG TPA: type II toxin-antitoxin system VapC family toxin [Candidatus Methylomirabilis sp.]
MPEAESAHASTRVLIDAGMFIAALLKGDPRHAEARPLVEQARQGEFPGCTTAGILSEVYGALTWEKAEPRHSPTDAAEAVRLLVEPPSAIVVLSEGLEVVLQALRLAASHGLAARRVHDARHAAAAIVGEATAIYTYDADDWKVFESDGLKIVGPPTTLSHMSQIPRRA